MIAFHVMGPTTPSGSRSNQSCTAITAACVCGPKMPSTVTIGIASLFYAITRRNVCSCSTILPDEPRMM